MSQPWYRDGLRFQCTQCGDCCTGAPGYVWVTQEEIDALAAKLGMDADTFERSYVRRVGVRRSLVEFPNGDCVFLDSQRRCTVYDARPQQCRTWPFWESNLKTPQAWKQTCEACPGCGRGEVVPLEEIARQASLVKV
jgi:Fe-S-cluster containining protein